MAQAGCVGPDSRICVRRQHLLAGHHVKVPDRCPVEELAAALKTIKAGKAGGPDGVAPDLLKHLPLSTQKELLSILNASWTTGW